MAEIIKQLGFWRVGEKVPLNVYDGDRPVCQCHSVEDAKRIVGAVNSQIADRINRYVPQSANAGKTQAARTAEESANTK